MQKTGAGHGVGVHEFQAAADAGRCHDTANALVMPSSGRFMDNTHKLTFN